MHGSVDHLHTQSLILFPSVAVLLDIGEVVVQDAGERVDDFGVVMEGAGVPGAGPRGEVGQNVGLDALIVRWFDLGRREGGRERQEERDGERNRRREGRRDGRRKEREGKIGREGEKGRKIW